LFANITANTSGKGGVLNLADGMEVLETRVTTVTEALSKMQQMQKGFQKQTMPDIIGGKGRSIFAGSEGGKKQSGRGLTPMNEALQEAQQMSLGASEGMSRYKKTTNAAGERIMQFMGSQERLNEIQKELQQNMGNTRNAFGKNFGKYMNLMFAGMALNMVLGGMRRKMMKMTGASKAMGAATKSALLPVFMALNPLFLEFSNFLIGLPRVAKMAVGALFLLASALAFVMLIGGQAGLFWQSWGDTIKSVAKNPVGSMKSALGRLKSGLLRVAGGIKTVITSTLTWVAGAVTSAIAATWSWVTANTALFATLGSILLVIGSLALGIFFLQKIFKKFGPVVGLLATILGSALLAALSPVAAAVMAVFGAFKAVNMIFKKFGKVIGTIAGVIVAIIGGIIAVFASVPIGVGLAIGAVLAIIWNLRDEIASVFSKIGGFLSDLVDGFKNWLGNAGNTVKNFVSDVVGFFKSLPQKAKGFIDDLIDKGKSIVSWFGSLGSKISNAVSNAASWLVGLGENLIAGVINGIKNMASALVSAITNILPDPLAKAIKAAGTGVGNVVGGVKDVLTPNDFILTSGGKMIQPDQNDTIVGFNGNGPIQPGAGGGETNITVNDPIVREEQDISRIVDEVEKRIDRNTRGRSGGLQ